MKNINLNQLRMVIREALGGEEQAPAGPSAGALHTSAAGEQKSDVTRALQYIGKIDKPEEFAQMLWKVMEHAAGIPQGMAILKKLYTERPGLSVSESKLNEDEGLPKRKPEHVDYDEGHEDGFEGKPKKKDRSKDYNEGFKDGKASDKEYKDVTKESKLNEDDAQAQPGGNWSQPGMEQDVGEPEAMPEGDIEAIATQVIEILRDLEHNDAVDVLTFAAEALGLAPPEEEPPPIGFRENLRQALIMESFKHTLKNAIKK